MELQKFQYYPMIQLFRKYVGEDFERDVRDLMNNELVISVSGGLCTGKTTLTKMLSEYYKLETYSVGNEFRILAKNRHVSIEEFVGYLETDPDMATGYDTITSYRTIKLMSSGGQNIKGLIVEGRLTGWYSILLEQMGRENVVRILLESDEPTKIKRIMKRHDISKNDSIAMLVRDQQDKCRWKNEFGISYDDHSIYHYIYENNDECSLESFMKNLEI
ncbi:MAG: cytidylate kinase family protein [Candidatus Aenigmarchaeota archaeon]|nr:cytidylate kinase family protein [Candidatus Aenigmarchaeota archaeon]